MLIVLDLGLDCFKRTINRHFVCTYYVVNILFSKYNIHNTDCEPIVILLQFDIELALLFYVICSDYSVANEALQYFHEQTEFLE